MQQVYPRKQSTLPETESRYAKPLSTRTLSLEPDFSGNKQSRHLNDPRVQTNTKDASQPNTLKSKFNVVVL